MAVKLVIEPIFEADFCDASYGFRPGKSAHDAIDEVTYTLHKELWLVQSADDSGLDEGACLEVKNIGKPCAGKTTHGLMREGGDDACSLLYPFISLQEEINRS